MVWSAPSEQLRQHNHHTRAFRILDNRMVNRQPWASYAWPLDGWPSESRAEWHFYRKHSIFLAPHSCLCRQAKLRNPKALLLVTWAWKCTRHRREIIPGNHRKQGWSPLGSTCCRLQESSHSLWGSSWRKYTIFTPASHWMVGRVSQ